MEDSKQGATMFGPTTEEIKENLGIMETNEKPADRPMKTAESYAERVKEKKRQASKIKGKEGPLGGADPIEPGKMDKLVPRPQFDDSPPEELPPSELPMVSPPNHPDMVEQPNIPGIGSAYEVNQAMARGELEKPITMAQAKKLGAEQGEKEKGLSKETLELMEKVEVSEETEFQKHDLEEVERAVMEPESDLPINFGTMSRVQQQLYSPERRKKIEDNLEELDLADLIVSREIQQMVEIIPGKFTATFRTFGQREHLFCLQYVFEEQGSQAYVEELLNTCKLVCSTVAINGAPLPEHREKVGQKDESITRDSFENKMRVLTSLPVQIVADLGIQCNWFNERVNKLLTFENVKNG